MGERILLLIFFMLDLVAFVIGLTQVLKMIKIPKNWLPVCAVVIGAVGNCILKDAFIALNVLEGMFIGMVAAGIINRIDESKKKKA